MKHSKNLLIAIAAASLFTAALPGYAVKKGKVEINHCGCSDDGSTLEWRIDNVNRNSCDKPTGHSNHEVGDPVTCTGGTFTRGGDDTLVNPITGINPICGSIDTVTAEDGDCKD